MDGVCVCVCVRVCVRACVCEFFFMGSTLSDTIKNKAEYFLLRGRTLNVVGKFSTDAHETLSKAVKLDPKSVDAWNHLGECYWKNGDMTGAKNCFSGALGHVSDEFFYQTLSWMCLSVVGLENLLFKRPPRKLRNKSDLQEGFWWIWVPEFGIPEIPIMFWIANSTKKITAHQMHCLVQ